MRVDFLGHATLLIRHGALSLLSDPWWSGPAYRDQWYPYPIPVPERFDLSRVDAVYISHSHEDHLHAPTLRELLRAAPDLEAIIPLRPDTQMRDYLRRIGFRRIQEAASGTPFSLRKGKTAMRLTLLTHVDDSLLGVEAGGEVLLNLNDALHSSRREMIVEYCRILRGRFPKIDYLFCGFGGASYFPNCVHVPGKDDVSVARARERWFLHNFALIAERLAPRLAFPFAAHFVLPDERNWWISETRLQMDAPSATLRGLADLGTRHGVDPSAAFEHSQPGEHVEHAAIQASHRGALGGTAFSGPQPGERLEHCALDAFPRGRRGDTAFYDLQPGDHVEDGAVHASPRGTVEPPAARAAVLRRYGPPPPRSPLDQAAFDELVDAIRSRVAARHVPARFDAVIVLWDYAPRAIHLCATGVESIDPAGVSALAPQVVMETRSDLVRSTLRSPFGKDLISIGYGAQFHMRSAADIEAAPHEHMLQLLAPTQPRWRQHLRERPWRTARYLLGDPSMRYAAAQRLLRRAQARTSEPAPYEMRDWVAAPEA